MRKWLGAALAMLAAPTAGADTLQDALTSAYLHNPTLNAARLSARAADEGRAQARANYLPSLDVAATAGTGESETNGVDNGSADPTSVEVTASQALYTGGFLRAQSSLARANVETAREGLRTTEQAVLLAVVAVYQDVRRDEETVRIREANVGLLQRQVEEANARFEVGDVTRTDVAQAGARLAGAESGLSGARAQLEASRARYLQIVGVIPQALETAPPTPDIPRSLDEAAEQALALNPELRAARQGERIARAQTGIERSALLPQLTIVGVYDRTDNGATGLAAADTEATSAAARLTIPLFEGGFARSRVRQSRINEQRAEQQTEEQRRVVLSVLTASWNDYIAAQRVAESSHQQLSANELAFEGVQAERSVGLRTTLEVLNAQQELLDSQLAVVSAERDSYVAAHALLQAIGRLDGGVLGVNAPLYDPAEHGRAVARALLSTQPVDIPLRGRED